MNSNIYKNIISAFASFLNVFGTIFAVLCVIRMSYKDVMRTKEAYRLDHKEIDIFKQRFYARCGIKIICVGFILQLCVIFCENMTKCNCLILSIISAIIIFIILLVERHRMKADIKHAEKENL